MTVFKFIIILLMPFLVLSIGIWIAPIPMLSPVFTVIGFLISAIWMFKIPVEKGSFIHSIKVLAGILLVIAFPFALGISILFRNCFVGDCL